MRSTVASRMNDFVRLNYLESQVDSEVFYKNINFHYTTA